MASKPAPNPSAPASAKKLSPAKAFYAKAKAYAVAHKAITAIAAVVILGGGYVAYGKLHGTTAAVRYVTATVQKGTIVASISGSGQVSASNQVDLKPKVSGAIVSVPVKAGQTVAAGQAIAYIDATDAEKQLRDAETSLETAQLSLQKLEQPADDLTLSQAQDALAQAKESKVAAQSNLTKAYSDGATSVSSAFLTLPALVAGMHDIIYKSTVSGNSQSNLYAYSDMVKQYDPNIVNETPAVIAKYSAAKAAYDKNLTDFQAISIASSPSEVQAIIAETYQTSQTISDSIKNIATYLQQIKDDISKEGPTVNTPAQLTTDLSSVNSDTNSINGIVTNLFSAGDTITSAQNSIASNDRDITEKTESLAKTQAGTDPLDLRSAQISVANQQNAVTDAYANLANYTIRAPFAGTIAALSAKKGDEASPGTAVASVITPDRQATLSLNEIDAEKIKVGDKATITFDAIDGLSIAGTLTEVDAIGTVSQGVVSYNATITFDSQDSRILPGMSMNASIIADSKTDVLVVPSSAVKTAGGSSYVLMFATPLAGSSGSTGATSPVPPTQVPVTTGLSNDTSVEITSGLNEGDQIVSRTITATTAATAAKPGTSLLGGSTAGGRGRAAAGFGG